MAQLVARYLGVVEAARSSRVTQTISSVHNRPEGLVWTLDCFLPEILFFIVAVQILSTAFSLGSGGIFYHLIQRRNRFIIRVTLNCCKRIIAYNRKHFSISIDEVVVPCELETKEDNCVYNAVLSLREKYRTAIYLFYFEDLPAKEIARILKTSEANIFMRLSRGRNMLKEKLEGVVDL